MGRGRAAERADLVRRVSAPIVAFVAAGLALCCLTTVPVVVAGWPAFAGMSPALPAWAGLALLFCMGLVIVTLLAAGRVGAGPPLALGSVAALLGLALARSPASGPQLQLALLTLTLAFGALACAGACMLEEVGSVWRRRVFVGWVAPLAGGWGVLAVRASGTSPGSLSIQAPVWLIVVSASVVLAWALLTIALEPARAPAPPVAGWENAWAALAVLCACLGTVVMLVGFQPDARAAWVRPVVVLTAAIALVGLLGCARLIPSPAARPAYLTSVTAMLVGPASLQVMVLVPAETAALPWWVWLTLLAGGAAGCWLGLRARRRRSGSVLSGSVLSGSVLSGSLLLMALAAAAGWVMPSSPALMCVTAVPFAFGLAAAVAAGLDRVAESRMEARYTTAGVIAALLAGLLAAGPVAWALGAPLTGLMPAARDGGRVLLGLSFAVLVLASAGVSVLSARVGRTVPLRPTCHRAGDLVDLPSGDSGSVG